MHAVRTHHYRVDPADLDELLRRRTTLITAIRGAHPGLVSAQLVRLQDGTYTDTWFWEDAEALGAALAAIKDFPEAPAAMSLTKDNAAQNGEVVAVD